MVGTDLLEVDQLLTGGELRCPDCAGELRPWGHARERGVRDETCVVALRPRRSWCAQCRCTHVLLPASGLVRRADTVAVIGRALLAKAAGAGHRSIAALLDRPVSTVRGWLRRFGARAEGLRVLFTALLHALDASAAAAGVTGSLFADALESLGLAAAAAARLFGPRPAWQFAAAASSGLLLGPGLGARSAANTS
ncbi:MAG: helix-turn-helix domain-containing protein [Nocardioidaceae bacterium]|nr:helix-turn-helix domain-containing protein [Nocardioidaceae bacterium]